MSVLAHLLRSGELRSGGLLVYCRCDAGVHAAMNDIGTELSVPARS